MKRARTIAAAALGAALLAGVHPAWAQGPDAGAGRLRESALPDVTGWLGEPGRSSFLLGSSLGLGFPRVVAGHARGGWRLIDDSRAPEAGPFPGLLAVLPPLAGYDTLEVEPASVASTAPAPSGELVRVRTGEGTLIGRVRPLATFVIGNGDFGRDETAITAERGGDRGGVRLESFAARRGEAGPYGLAGRHRWGATLEQLVGKNHFTAAFRQAGLAARLRSHEEQTARGASGSLAWRRRAPGADLNLALSRQWDVHESFGGTLAPQSRRDAQQLRITGGAVVRRDSRRAGFRFDWHRDEVRRQGPGAFDAYSGDDWGGVFVADERPARQLRAELDVGRIGSLDRYEVAPGLFAQWNYETGRVELWARRLLEPVWHDLAGGERNFLQSTWAAGAGGVHTSGHGHAALRVMGGVTRDRALIARRPLEEQWLRLGMRRDDEQWEFVLLWGELRRSWGGWSAGFEGTGLVADRNADQARVDPAVTGRAFGQWDFQTFGDDLHVTLRAEADAVGSHTADPDPGPVIDASPLRTYPGYVTGGASLIFGVGDARIVFRVRNLENGTHEDVWFDAATGEIAKDTPRELRIAVAWSLKN